MSWREHLAQLVVADLADIGAAAPSEATAAMVLAQEPPETSRAGPMPRVEHGHALLVDQRHGALGQLQLLDQASSA